MDPNEALVPCTCLKSNVFPIGGALFFSLPDLRPLVRPSRRPFLYRTLQLSNVLTQEDFPGLHERMADAIRSLGGKVFPKLTWSCPKVTSLLASTREV